eukprot:5762936-Pyramimonas_sp.AAC.2
MPLLYGSSCADNGKGALDTPETLKADYHKYSSDHTFYRGCERLVEPVQFIVLKVYTRSGHQSQKGRENIQSSESLSSPPA